MYINYGFCCYGCPYNNGYRQEFDLGTTWIVNEGGGWVGTWNRRGDSNVFDARWKKAGQRDVTAVVTINVNGRTVTAKRRYSSDGNECNYSGTLEPNGWIIFRGHQICRIGGGEWSGFIHGQKFSLGRYWEETESGIKGRWTRRGDTNVFDAAWTLPNGSSVSAVMTVTVNGNTINVKRTNSSDGNDCEYAGLYDSTYKRVSGSYKCKSGGGNWEAYINIF